MINLSFDAMLDTAKTKILYLTFMFGSLFVDILCIQSFENLQM